MFSLVNLTILFVEFNKLVFYKLDRIRPNQGSSCNPGTTDTEAEARKFEKYHELTDNGYIFQPVALEVQGSLGESSLIFITRLCKMLSFARRLTTWQLFEATDFPGSSDWKCSLCSGNCERQRCVRRNVLHIVFFTSISLPSSSSVLKKNTFLFIMCPEPGRQTKKLQPRKETKKMRNEIMQPESSMDRGHFNSETH